MKPQLDSFQPGQRYRIARVHHPVFNGDLGKIVVIVRVNPEFRSAWVYEEGPVLYKTNRKKERVIASDPKNIQTVVSLDSLEPVEG
jgi:hypothetical protein